MELREGGGGVVVVGGGSIVTSSKTVSQHKGPNKPTRSRKTENTCQRFDVYGTWTVK